MKKLLYKHGKKFVIVSTPKEIILVPISKRPLTKLRKIGKEAGIDKYMLKELREIAREEAEREALSNIKVKKQI